ncbi:hypothetical protein HK102_012486 [Quaeritorhiza haematococci]|nr:hypothetical protein HK102_012486 [Quaeritorhiza haematococci]
MSNALEPRRRMLNGPPSDPLNFYATTYSTVHTAKIPPKNTVHKQITGYTRGCIPFVSYDRSVDEGELFRSAGEDCDLKPSINPPAVGIDEEPTVDLVRDSGFTRIPIQPKKHWGTEDLLTTSSRAFTNKVQALKRPDVKKEFIVKSCSAYTNDVAHLHVSDEPDDRFKKPPVVSHLQQEMPDANPRMTDTGFSRSTRMNFLVHRENKPTQMDRILSQAKTRRQAIGLKELTGPARNNHAFFPMQEGPESRFVSETKDR